MYCHEIKIENFRNIKGAIVVFDEGINLVVGNNAQGKTNLLEAVYFAAIGKSFRSVSSSDLIAFGHPKSEVMVIYTDSIRMQVLAIQVSSDRQKIVEQNGLRIRSTSDLVGRMRVVLFIPEHLSLVKEGPAERRSWIDSAMCQIYPGYLTALSRFNKALKNRNRLLKDFESDKKSFYETIDFWSDQVAREATVLTEYRNKYVERASELVGQFFTDMTGGKEKVELVYAPSCKLNSEDIENSKVFSEYNRLLSSNYDRETTVGNTLWGSHKDDIEILINGKSAREFASQGQQRSIALAMKLAEGEICKDNTGDSPIFLFDDVLSELDLKRRTYLLSELKDKQVIMTSCDTSFTGDAHVIKVENGKYYYDATLNDVDLDTPPTDEDDDMKII